MLALGGAGLGLFTSAINATIASAGRRDTGCDVRVARSDTVAG